MLCLSMTSFSKFVGLFGCCLLSLTVVYTWLQERNVSYINLDYHFPPEQICTVGERFLSLGLDTITIYEGLDKLNLNSPKLRKLTSKLSPAYIRFGGTMADRLIFLGDPSRLPINISHSVKGNVDCQDDLCIAKFLPFFIMTGSDFLQIVEFSKKVNMRLIFDLNALLRDGDDWNPANAIMLFEFAKSHNVDIDWQLGNEPNSFQHVFNTSVSPEQLGKDFKVLRQLVQKYFPNSLLVGPDTTRPQPNRPECVIYMKRFLNVASGYVDAMAWHQYYLNGRIATLEDFWSPATLNLLQTQIDTMVENTKHFQSFLKMWLTETSSAYGGGAPYLSNSYAAIPLWLDKLGTAAKNGIQVVARQSLLRGNYSLIDENHNPSPDYWISVLFKELVGNQVLPCSVKTSLSQRFYCHCAAQPSNTNDVVIYGMNLDGKPSIIQFTGSAFKSVTHIDEYTLTAPGGNRMSNNILLNNVLLKYDDDFPELIPKYLKPATIINMPPYSFSFWKIYNTDISICSNNV